MLYANPRSSTKAPLLEYFREGDAWQWRGTLLSDPGQADGLAARMQAAFEEVFEYLSETHPKDAGNIRRVTFKSDELLEIETGGDDFALQNKGGFPWVHVVGRYRPATVADFSARRSLGEGGSRIGSRAAKGSGASFIPIQDTAAWKNVSPRSGVAHGEVFHEGLSRVILSALKDVKSEPGRQRLSSVLFEKDGSDLMAAATDGHRMTVHRFLKEAPSAEFDKKSGKAPVPLPAVKDLLRDLLKQGSAFALDVSFDLRRKGEPGNYSWTPQNPDETVWEGSVISNGRDYPVPVLDPEQYPNWRTVLPKAGELSWQLVLNSGEVADALEALGRGWKAAFAEVNGRNPKGKGYPKSVTGWLHKNGLALSHEDPRGEGARLQQEISGHSAKGLSSPVPFLVNPKYLSDALGTVGGDFLLTGYGPDTTGNDGEKYLSKPLVFFDASGPTQTLLMPMWPPR